MSTSFIALELGCFSGSLRRDAGESTGVPRDSGRGAAGSGPLLQDEVYRIARELLREAFRHAQAGRIEAEIRYESHQLRVHVRDDGTGIDPEILKVGRRARHSGLPGMRERATRFSGKFESWIEAGACAEVLLTVPAAVAYSASNGGPFSFLRRKKAGSRTPKPKRSWSAELPQSAI